jgi:hypothetical protein
MLLLLRRLVAMLPVVFHSNRNMPQTMDPILVMAESQPGVTRVKDRLNFVSKKDGYYGHPNHLRVQLVQ